MDIPLDIAFQGMEPSPAVEARIRSKAAWLSHYYGRITSCHILITAPHKHHQKGKIYHVKITIHMPGRHDIVVNREPEENQAHEDIYVAIRDAFDSARRQVRDVADKMSGKVKTLRGPRRRVEQ